jgi:site-specific DNA recombinase
VTRQIGKLVEALKDGVPAFTVKDELVRLENRRAELTPRIEHNPEPRPLRHPGMADLFRRKVATLCESLSREDARPQATEALRGLLDEIVLEPEGAELKILVKATSRRCCGSPKMRNAPARPKWTN